MTVLITLTTAGTDSGPFNLYSNLDGYTSAFATGVSKSALVAGYSSAVVPDYTTIIRVVSIGVCTNYIDITLTGISTTTTTTTNAPITCSATVTSGGAGVTEYTVALDSIGGVIVFEFNAYSIPDKLEIIHNGIKKATSGMTVSNEGPFDNLYGDPTVPTYAQTLSVDQFIGNDKATIPTRQTTFTSNTGSAITIESGFQQLVWFQYSSLDYSDSHTALIRITGANGTAWDLKRLCNPTTTTTTTTVAPTTTTTTTSRYYTYNLTEGTILCPNGSITFGSPSAIILYSASSSLGAGINLWKNTALTIPSTSTAVKSNTTIYSMSGNTTNSPITLGDPC